MRRAGHIELAFRYVSAADQSQIPVSGKRRVKGSNSAGLIGIGIAATAPTPLAPLFLLAHGHDTEILVGTAFTVYTEDDACGSCQDSPYSSETSAHSSPDFVAFSRYSRRDDQRTGIELTERNVQRFQLRG